jgi:hypothetical protein
MCLHVSRLFWVSSLAYPNLLGTKGYVVVVVGNMLEHNFCINVSIILLNFKWNEDTNFEAN